MTETIDVPDRGRGDIPEDHGRPDWHDGVPVDDHAEPDDAGCGPDQAIR